MKFALRVGLLVALAKEPGYPSQQPGKRRLETRGEIMRVASPNQSRLARLIDTRVRSALLGRVLLAEQPSKYCTGLSPADEQAFIDCVERHFSFAPLDRRAETALAIEMDQIGATLEEGLGVRNQLYHDRHASFRGGLPSNNLLDSWEQLPEACAHRLAHVPQHAESGRPVSATQLPPSRPFGGGGVLQAPGCVTHSGRAAAPPRAQREAAVPP